MKRAVALLLAVLIAMGTLGYLFTTIAYAADPGFTDITPEEGGSSFENVQYKITKGAPIKKDDQVSLTIKLTAKTGTSVDTGGSVTVDTNKSAFAQPNTGSTITITNPSGSDYTIEVTNIKYQGGSNAGKLALDIPVTGGSPVLLVLDLSSELDSGGGQDEPVIPDPEPGVTTGAGIHVNLRAVYRGDHQTYEAGSATLNDPDIGSERSKSGYTADFDVTITDPDVSPTEIADPITGFSDQQVKINAALNSGSFRYGSGSKVTLKSVKALEGGGAQYVLAMRRLKYNGKGDTLTITIIGKDKGGGALMTEYTTRVSTTIDQCIPYNENADDDDDDGKDYSSMEMATPYVIVSSYSYGGTVTAGDTFPLTLTFYNTSAYIDVQNMMITLSMPEALMLTSSSNTFYVSDLGREESVTQTVQVTAKANAAPQSHNVEVSMKYQYIDDHLVSRRDNSTQETISIPVVQVDRFQATGVDIPNEAYIGEETNVTVNFVNKGRSDVYNLSAEISGDIQNPGQQQNLGNLTSGSTGSADFYIIPNGEGVCSGEVKITYEDTNMEEKTVTMLWSTNVVDPMAGMDPGMMYPGMNEMEDPGMMEEEKKPAGPFIAGGVGAAALVVGFIIYRRVKKKRSEEEDANL